MAEDLQSGTTSADTNIFISPQPKPPSAPAPAPVFQPVIQPPVIDRTPITQRVAGQPVIQEQPIVQQQPIFQPQPFVVQQPPAIDRRPITQRQTVTQRQTTTQQEPVYVPAEQQVVMSNSTHTAEPIHLAQEGTYTSPTKSTTTSKVHQTTTTKHKITEAKTKSTTHLNWGGVVKGAAVITAAVVVGVGVYYGAAALTTWAMGVPAVASSMAWISANIITPVGAALSSAGAWLTGTAWPAITGAASSAWASVSSWAGLSGGTGAATTLAPHVVRSTATTVGVVAGAGALTATASHLTFPNLEHTSLVSHGHTITPEIDKVDVTSTVVNDPTVTHTKAAHHDAGQTAAAFDITDNAIISSAEHAHHAAEQAHQAAELGQHTVHLTNHKVQATQAATADNNVDAGTDVSAPDVDFDDADLAKFSKPSSHRSWSEKLFGSKRGAENLTKKSADYSASVNRRSGNFTEALDEDRARLATMMDSQRA